MGPSGERQRFGSCTQLSSEGAGSLLWEREGGMELGWDLRGMHFPV